MVQGTMTLMTLLVERQKRVLKSIVILSICMDATHVHGRGLVTQSICMGAVHALDSGREVSEEIILIGERYFKTCTL